MSMIRNVLPTMSERNLGLGFGEDNEFIIKLNETNKGLINTLPFSEEVMDELRSALQERIKNAITMKKTKQPITNVDFEDVLTHILKKYYKEEDIQDIVSSTLALLIPDILVDVNVTRLTKHIIPSAMKDPALRTLISKGLDKFFKFDEQGNINFFIGEDGNNNSHYQPQAAFKNNENK